ncbi:transporter [Neorhizobium sp. DAR64861/K0K2]|uniref:transporter n=1 Tax=Neorhizobium sp. DAR64861/K0K2 TaxID=3421956 RepID=UPI003D2E5219
MSDVAGSIPTGFYDANRLANIGMGHAAIDLGGACSYLDPQTGWEFSVTAGLTKNLENPSTDYTSGMDAHVDMSMAKLLTEKLFVGVVGHAYEQTSPHKGQAPIVGDFKSSAIEIGRQPCPNPSARAR